MYVDTVLGMGVSLPLYWVLDVYFITYWAWAHIDNVLGMGVPMILYWVWVYNYIGIGYECIIIL